MLADWKCAKQACESKFGNCMPAASKSRVALRKLLLITLAVVRGKQLFGDAARGIDGGVEGFAVVLGKAFALGQAFGIQYFIEFKGQVAGAEQ